MNNRKKIIAVILLIFIVILAVISGFVAYRINTQVPVAPTAPTSKPKASAGLSCVGSGGSCQPGTTCGNNPNDNTNFIAVTNTDCPAGNICCLPTGNWATSTSCTTTFSVAGVACTPRQACLDGIPKPCEPAAPAGGYCPTLTCPNGKTVYKDIADNTPGVYNADVINQIAKGSSIIPGQTLVYSIDYTAEAGVDSAKIDDLLDNNLEFVDASNGCTKQSGSNLVLCNLTKENIAAGVKPKIRVKVKEAALPGILPNSATISATYAMADGTVSTDVSSSMCSTSLNIAVAPAVAVACKGKTALNANGTEIINSIGKNETFIYSLELTNTGNTIAPDVITTDTLSAKLVFVDSSSGCTFDETSRKVTCKTSLGAGETKKVTFNVKTTTDVTDGETIENTANTKLESSATAEAGSDCAKSLIVSLPKLDAVKEAYKDNTNNTPGNYQLTDVIDTVAKNQIFAYAIKVTNSGTGTASGITINDPLTGQNQDQLTFIDKDPRCEWTAATKLIKCSMDLQPGASNTVAFRVSVSDGVVNGGVIVNGGVVSHQGTDINVSKSLTISTIVACNHTCTGNAECETGYTCDSATGKCRSAQCATVLSCVCPATVTAAPTAAPRIVVITAAPTTKIAATATPTTVVAETLPETGIFDVPGATIFGGGLLLAILGILLAL